MALSDCHSVGTVRLALLGTVSTVTPLALSDCHSVGAARLSTLSASRYGSSFSFGCRGGVDGLVVNTVLAVVAILIVQVVNIVFVHYTPSLCFL